MNSLKCHLLKASLDAGPARMSFSWQWLRKAKSKIMLLLCDVTMSCSTVTPNMLERSSPSTSERTNAKYSGSSKRPGFSSSVSTSSFSFEFVEFAEFGEFGEFANGFAEFGDFRRSVARFLAAFVDDAALGLPMLPVVACLPMLPVVACLPMLPVVACWAVLPVLPAFPECIDTEWVPRAAAFFPVFFAGTLFAGKDGTLFAGKDAGVPLAALAEFVKFTDFRLTVTCLPAAFLDGAALAGGLAALVG